jgi:hypothetical protein
VAKLKTYDFVLDAATFDLMLRQPGGRTTKQSMGSAGLSELFLGFCLEPMSDDGVHEKKRRYKVYHAIRWGFHMRQVPFSHAP